MTNFRTPGMRINISAAPTPFSGKNKLLLIGHMNETGLDASKAKLDTPYLLNDGNIETLFGKKSQLAAMYKVARMNAPMQEIWATAVDDIGAKATATIEVQNAATNLGECVFYIAGVRHSVEIIEGDSNNVVAGKIANKINTSSIIVDATSNAAIVTLTSCHASDLNIALDLSIVGDEGVVGKNTLTITDFSGGNGYPDISDALINLNETEYDYIAAGFNNTSTLKKVKDFLDNDSGRWSGNIQLYGHYVTAKHGSQGELAAFGLTLNDAHKTVADANDSSSPTWEWAAALGAKFAKHLAEAPELSRPLQTLVLKGIRAHSKVRDVSEREVLLHDGITTFTSNASGQVAIERAITTYRVTENNIADTSWLDVNTLAQNVYFARSMKARIWGKYPRVALVDKNPTGRPAVVSADDIRQELIQGFLALEQKGVCENLRFFESNLTVERVANDANGLLIYWGTDFVNQLMTITVNAKSHLQAN